MFLLCGLWHGAAWTFVLWRLYHGSFLALERAGFARVLASLPLPLRHAYALLVVLFGWVLFRADGLDQAGAYWAAMLGAGAASGSSLAPTNEVLFALAVGLVAATPLAGRLARLGCEAREDGTAVRAALVRNAWLCGLLGVFVLAAARLATDAYNPFIYFRF